jgi:primosomal protein N' (replication factor Y)
MDTLYADIVLRLAVPRTFQFSVPEEFRDLIRPGQRVRVPLRRGSDIGYVARLTDTPRVKGIRPVLRILERVPLLPPDLLELLMWTSEHYLAPPGMVFRTALPRAIHFERTSRATAREKTIRSYRLTVTPGDLPVVIAGIEKRAPAQARLLAFLADGPRRRAELQSFSPSSLKSAIAAGWVREEATAARRGLVPPLAPGAEPSVFTDAQRSIYEQIGPTLSQRDFSPFLIHGVTGSGKTELYLRAVQDLPPGRQAIILVPEVTLTVQLIRHFQERLPFPLAVWHHQLSEGEKYDLWRLLRRGEARVVIGARSAVFAPMPDLGLIVVDEEQESSYKQEDTPAYHARDLALARGRLRGATVVLGSATPSIESYHQALGKELTLLSLGSRFGGSPLPAVELIDLKDCVGGAKPALITEQLLEASTSALESGSQVLFFLNRRGYAPFTHCGDCGQALKCPNCQVSLVFHRQDNSLLCHYCGFLSPPPDTCPSCRGTQLRLSGTGTQRLEEEIRRLFPRWSVARLDRDTTTRKGAGGRLVTDFAAGKIDILVGTQMAAKGLHFPRLTIVGVLAPDLSLNLPDFRAAERTFQVITQVAGRAGRGTVPGKVIVQTRQPEHYALQAASRHDFPGFYVREIEFRRELEYPPFCDLILLRVDGPNEGRLEQVSDRIGERVRALLKDDIEADRCQVLGPVPAPLRKIRNRYRSHLLIKSKPLERAAAPLRTEAEALLSLSRKSNCRLVFDVNPANLM